MKKSIITSTLIFLTLLGCATDTTFTITNDQVGPLTRDATITSLSTVFANDSIVNANGNQEFTNASGDITVYEKGGKKLLLLSPASGARNSVIKFIQILDKRYATQEGITTSSTFKNIQDAYTLKRIDNLIGSVVIFVNESEAYFTIDKKHLPTNMMFDTDSKIEASQIPDEAPIKYLMIGW